LHLILLFTQQTSGCKFEMAEMSAVWPVSKADLDACQISVWYPKLKKYALRTVLVPVSSEFNQYILSDGVVLPEVPHGEKPPTHDPRYRDAASSVHSSSSDEETSDDGQSDSTPPPPCSWCFPEIEDSIQTALQQLPDGAFVKGTWSGTQVRAHCMP
jgi:hypothetical protein